MAAEGRTCPTCQAPTDFAWLMDASNPTESLWVEACTVCRWHQPEGRCENQGELPCGLGECWCW